MINPEEAEITILIKHLFKDIGLPQRYSFVHIKKTRENKKIIFTTKSIFTHKPDTIKMPEDAILLPLNNLTCSFDIITPNKVDCTFDVLFANYLNIPLFAEKIIGLLLFKVFKRTKQFIENITI
jgi:hypothetical protein